MSSNLHLYLLSLGISAAIASDAAAISPKHQGVDIPAPIAQRQHSLRQAPATINIPGIKTLRNGATRQQAPAALRAKGRNGETTLLYGNQIYSSTWTSMSQCGIYTLDPATGSTSAVFTDPNLYGVGGAVYYDGKYYALNYTSYNNQIVDIAAYVYDTQSWTLTQHKQLNPSEFVGSIALDLAYDATTSTVYGLFYAGNFTVYLGTLDMRTFKPAKVADLPAETNLNSIAFTADGRLYATDDTGNFYSVDKATAQLNKISSIGDESHFCYYYTTAAIDDATSTYYYSYQPEEGDGTLYGISLADGKWNVAAELANQAQFAGLYVPQPLASNGAPAAVTAATIDFDGGSLSGHVYFTMPSVSYGGTNLDGTLDYTIEANGTVVASGSAAPGSVVSAPVTLDASGVTVFTIRTSNAEGSAPKYEIEAYIGTDAPKAVTDLSAEKTSDTEITISWTAPAESVNGGYFDADAVTYTVVRRPDGKVVAEDISATECSDIIADMPMASYYYEVTANAGDAASAVAATDPIVLGSYVSLPIDHQFKQSDNEFGLYTVIDANGDNKKWMAGTTYVYMLAPAKEQEAEDDWLITPPVRLIAGKTYTLEFEAGLNTTGTGTPEGHMDVMLGTGKTPEALSTNLVSTTHGKKGSGIDYTVTTKDFTVPADGIYHIGFHAVTPKATSSGLRIRYIKISSASIPVAGEIVGITPAAAGALSASVEYTAPSKDLAGADLEGPLTINVYVGGELKKTVENVAPGATVTFDVETAQGNSTIAVSAANADGEGAKASGSVYTGFDYPLNPTDVKAVLSADGKTVTLSWTAPGAAGEQGGYVPVEQLSYYIFDAFGQLTDPAIASTSATSYVFDYSGKDFGAEGQDFVAFQVTATYNVGQQELASYPGTNSNILAVGKPWSLPFSETFPDATPEHTLWGIDYAGTSPRAEFAVYGDNQYFEEYDENDNPVYINSQDADGGFIVMGAESNGYKVGIYSGMIDISGTTTPVLEFQTRATANQLDVMLAKANGEYTTVRTLDFKEEPCSEWTAVRIPLNGYISAGTIQFELLVTTKDASYYGTNYVAIDHIRVRDIRDYNISISRMSAPSEVFAGQKFSISAKVTNDGLRPSKGASVEMLHNGSVLLAKDLEGTLEPDESVTVSFDDILLYNDTKGPNFFGMRISSGTDEDESDNLVEKFITVKPAEYDGVDGLTATLTSDPASAIVLSWNAPDIDAMPRAEEILEDFESYEAFTIEDFGPWTLVDEDGNSTYGAYDEDTWEDYDYPHAGDAMAFQIFNAGQINATPDAYGAYSGSQCAIAPYCYNGSDWMISPELSGVAQTISFMAAFNSSLTYGMGDVVEVWYSTGSTDIADFIQIKSYDCTNKWTLVSADLPEGARRFAIRGRAGYNGVRIDDIRYKAGDGVPADLAIVGYNIYRNGILVNTEPVADTTYTDIPAKDGTYRYRVSAIYNYGETDPCEAVSADFSAIGTIGADAAPVRYFNLQGIEIDEPAPDAVVIRVQGRTATKQLRQ